MDYLRTPKGKEKPKKFTLNPSVKAMFVMLKSAFKKAPLLIHFDLKAEIHLKTNTSIIAFVNILT